MTNEELEVIARGGDGAAEPREGDGELSGLASRFGLTQACHHPLLSCKLEAVERGEIKRLMVFMPPDSTKSTYGNWALVPWYLGRKP